VAKRKGTNRTVLEIELSPAEAFPVCPPPSRGRPKGTQQLNLAIKQHDCKGKLTGLYLEAQKSKNGCEMVDRKGKIVSTGGGAF